MDKNLQADDVSIVRNRKGRWVVFGLSWVLAALAGGLVGFVLIDTFISQLPSGGLIGFVAGIGAGLLGMLSIKHLFVVSNDTTGVLVTTDALRSLLKKPDVNVIYGPGTHISFPWEIRYAQNNIPVKEVAEDFTFTAMCLDGDVTGNGSFRIRPDYQNPVSYLSGVAAAATDLRDLVIAQITNYLADKSISESNKNMEELNVLLKAIFVGNGVTDFEARFGLRVGDVTVGVILPSVEVRRTRSALNEARVVAEGAAILLGMTEAEIKDGLSSGKLKPADVDKARRDFRVISGNMDGTEVKRWEIDISGADPEAMKAIASLLGRTPPEVLAKVVSPAGPRKVKKPGVK